ncbi:MAG: GNAT family N-acetyltransferase [Planctomycetales bacterium]|nr:GNAT family N-acetyltransferase [Planctomycetales bacterium]
MRRPGRAAAVRRRAPRLRVARVGPSRVADFFAFQCPENGNDWCHCVAWWVPTWDGWGDRTEVQNRRLRERLFARGEYDGYLLYLDGRVSGWCQAGPRDRLRKLVKQYALAPDPEGWAITCIELAPACRARGLAHEFLRRILAALRKRGARRVQAFPERGKRLRPGAVWTGPEALYANAGFGVVRDDPKRPVMERRL